MSTNSDEKPKIEYAKSGRSTCRICHNKITKDSIRVGLPTAFTLPDGNTVISYKYFHPECVTLKEIPSVLGILETSAIFKASEKKEIRDSLNKAKEKHLETTSLSLDRNKPYFEYSKSGRAKCRICENPIEKDIFRIAEPSLVELADGRKIFGSKLFHIECYVTSNPDLKIDDLIKYSLKQGKINENDSKNLESELKQYFVSDKGINEILSLIKEKPIVIEKLKAEANKKRISFDSLNQAIEKGLIQGIFFQPTSETIQRL